MIVFEIKNSKRIMNLIEAEIRSEFEKKFGETDSIIVLNLSKQCKVTKYGYAQNDDEELIII
jgi:CRISPR-associated protein Cas2